MINLLKLEPGLSARITQVANNPFYSFGLPVGAVEEAVQRIGYAEGHRLVMLILGIQFHPQPLRACGLGPRELWNHSIAVAFAARHTAGLLHHVGMVGLDALLRKRAPSLRLAGEPWPDNTGPRPDPEIIDHLGTSLEELVAITEKVTKGLDEAW